MSTGAYLVVLPDCERKDADGRPVDLDHLENFGFVWLSPGMAVVVSALGRSKVYHGVKRQLSGDAPLLVAPLADAPKFKGLAEGATAWVRENF